jgi:hypothetical protein
MDYKELYDGKGSPFKRLVVIPFLVGILFGIGNFAAYIVLNNTCVKQLRDSVIEIGKEATH